MEIQRFLIIQRSCKHCRKYLGVIEKVNRHLDIKNRIKIFDETNEKYGVIKNEIVKYIKWDSFPYLYLDSYVKEGALNSGDAYGFLYGYLKTRGEWKEI